VKTSWRLASLSVLLTAFLVSSSIACWPWSNSQDTLRLWDIGPITLDPAISADMSSHTYVMQIFSGLVRLDHDLNVVPDIAESWDKSADGRAYTFHLRQGVKFHSGSEVNAADFKYSWERACDPSTGSGTAATYLGDIVGAKEMLAGEVADISGVEVIDEYTLRVTIDASKAYFLDKLAYPTAFVVDSANVESGQYWWLEPDGTGPFELKSWTPGQQLVLERSETYYGEPARLRSIIFSLTATDPMALYETGQIDVAPVYLDYIDAVTDETNPFHLELAVTPELSLYYIGFNTAEPPFDDVDVRRAFCRAVDKEHIVEVILRDMVAVADGILPPGMPGYDEALEGLDYNVEEAKDLIAASEYGDVSELPPITLTIDGYGNAIPSYLGAIIQEWQRNLGVEISVRQVETDRLIYNLKQEKDETFTLGWIADYPDPHNFLDVLFYAGSEVNIGEYSSPALDALLDQAAVEQDQSTRLAMYRQAEQLVVDDAPCIPLWHNINYVLVKPYVKGYELSAQGIPDLRSVYIDRS